MKILVLLVIVGALLAGTSCKRPGSRGGATGAKDKVVLAVGGKTAVVYLPLTVAEQQGFFEAEGLDVEIQDVQGGAKALQALVGGSADVVIGYYDHTIQMHAKNKQITAIALLGRYPGLVLGVRSDLAGVSSIDGLKGLRVGVTAPGSSTQFMADFLLTKHGLRASDISIIGIGAGSTAVAAIEQKQVDALVNMDPMITVLEARGLIRLLVDTRTERGTNEVFGGEYPGASLYTTQEFIEQRPSSALRLVMAIIKALRWIHGRKPEQIAAGLPESLFVGNRELYLKGLVSSREMFSPDGRFSETAPPKVLNVLSQFDESVAHATIDVSKTYTNRFVEEATRSMSAE
ncbi:MAG TPA: ABC transporter substrate-binding protein [Blastocatellia bacterium]|nr:ABC transporter substrate-binding protein [Blastocatellia bacterium]